MLNKLNVIGLMSGTSLDGLDIVHCTFVKDDESNFRINKAETISFPKDLKAALSTVYSKSALEFVKIHNEFGVFLGKQVNQFVNKNKLKADLIASHGQTIFHQPRKNFTSQIGAGEKIYVTTGIPTISDFRSLDVALGGNGAPLVPIGDKILFSKYDACLNLGGFSNISFDKEGTRIAFDISPFNLPLNKYVNKYYNLDFDSGGEIAREGSVNTQLLEKLNSLEFYNKSSPKSLGVEWLEESFYPTISKSIEPKELLNTLIQHFTDQVANVLNENKIQNVLVTGGGAYHDYFIETLKKKTLTEIILPSKEIIDFKEALIFAFLGYLKINNKINILSSVTGSSKNSIGGVLYAQDEVDYFLKQKQ